MNFQQANQIAINRLCVVIFGSSAGLAVWVFVIVYPLGHARVCSTVTTIGGQVLVPANRSGGKLPRIKFIEPLLSTDL